MAVTGKLSENSLAMDTRPDAGCGPGNALGADGDRKWTVLNIRQMKAVERLLYLFWERCVVMGSTF